MKKIYIIILTALLLLPVLLVAQREIMTIDNPMFIHKSRPAVKFNHGEHMMNESISCTECHHRYENGKNVLDPAELSDENMDIFCSRCHTDETALKKAYHRLCIRCHESGSEKKKASGPVLCGECHKQ